LPGTILGKETEAIMRAAINTPDQAGDVQKKPIRAAIYTRVSTPDQAREGYSLAAQLSAAEDYCKKNEYVIAAHYEDAGISGKAMEIRPGFISLIEAAKLRNFDVIVVWKITRFSRTLGDLISTCEALEKKYEVYLESITESFNSRTSAGRLMRGVIASVAQWEREIIGENTKSGIAARARSGEPMCSRILGYDYVAKNTFVINPEEAEIVREIFRLYLQYKHASRVSAILKERGIKGKRGGQLAAHHLRGMLSNPFFCGYVRSANGVYRGHHAPIITVETFNIVQKTMVRCKDTSPRCVKYPIQIISV
jgi:site-specific DNA recombinase